MLAKLIVIDECQRKYLLCPSDEVIVIDRCHSDDVAIIDRCQS